VKPAKALLKGQKQIFVVKISPKEVKTYKHKLKVKLNDNKKYDQVNSAEDYKTEIRNQSQI
jgi:hypothetical protein